MELIFIGQNWAKNHLILKFDEYHTLKVLRLDFIFSPNLVFFSPRLQKITKF